MYVCRYLCVYIHIYVCQYVNIYIYTCTYIYICVYIYVYICAPIHREQALRNTCDKCVSVNIYVYIHKFSVYT